MKILLFSDLHLDMPFRWAPPATGRKLRRALKDALTQIVRLAREHQVDVVACAGDLYEHETFTADTVEFVRQQFEELSPIRVLLAPGNHDYLCAEGLYRRARFPDNVHLFETPGLEPFELAPGLTVWGASHTGPDQRTSFLEGFRVPDGGVHLGLFHGAEEHSLSSQTPGKRPHAPFRSGQIREAGLSHALVGHFHTPNDSEFFTYAGNPHPLEFGEDGERGVVVLEIGERGLLSRSRLKVPGTVFHDVSVDLSEASNSHEAWSLVSAALQGKSGVARVTLTGEIDPELELRESDFEPPAELIGHRLRSQTTLKLDVARQSEASERTVRGRFVADVLASDDLTEEERQAVVLIGLRALAGRSDLLPD